MTWELCNYTLIGIFAFIIASALLCYLINKEKKIFEELITGLFISLVFYLISFIFILSPGFNKYILILNPIDSNSGSAAVIISITLGLAFCGPVFLFILDRIKEKGLKNN